jgi:hypothetical protein
MVYFKSGGAHPIGCNCIECNNSHFEIRKTVHPEMCTCWDCSHKAMQAEIDELRAELAWEQSRLRVVAQIIIESVGADGPMDAEDAAKKILAELLDAQATARTLAECIDTNAMRLPYLHHETIGNLNRLIEKARSYPRRGE